MPALPVSDGVYFVREGDLMRIVVTAADGQPLDLLIPGDTRFAQIFPESAQWVVNHNLGAIPSSVTVLSSGGVEVEANIVHISDNQFVVDLNPAMAGQVVVR